MPETDTIIINQPPLSLSNLVEQFAICGLAAGQTVLFHSSMSKFGWINGGSQTVIEALLQVLGPAGTLMMPTHTSNNTEPSRWQNPPVPEDWWPLIRAERPAYDPHLTPTYWMGAIPELFRTWPGVIRSEHPIGSFAAYGPNAINLTENHHSLQQMFGNESPIGKLYQLDGYIMLAGVKHDNNTSLHLAEYRANFPGKRFIDEGTVMFVNGGRQWVTFEMQSLDTDDFSQIGDLYEAQNNIPRHKVGRAEVRFMRQVPLVDFAVAWMNQNRNFVNQSPKSSMDV